MKDGWGREDRTVSRHRDEATVWKDATRRLAVETLARPEVDFNFAWWKTGRHSNVKSAEGADESIKNEDQLQSMGGLWHQQQGCDGS